MSYYVVYYFIKRC